MTRFTTSEREALLARVPGVRAAILANLRPFAQRGSSMLPVAGADYPGAWLEHCQGSSRKRILSLALP